MNYILYVLILASGYYTFTFGADLWSNKKNKLGGAAVIAASAAGSIFPIVVLFMKS